MDYSDINNFMDLHSHLLNKINRKFKKINTPNINQEKMFLKHRVFKDDTQHIALYLEVGKKKEEQFITFVSLDEAVLLNNLGVPEVN